MVRAQARCHRADQRTAAANRPAISLDGAGDVDLVGLPIRAGAGTNLAIGLARTVGISLGRLAAQPGGALVQRGLYRDSAGIVLAAAAGDEYGVLAEPGGHPYPAGAAPIRQTPAGAL